MKYPVVWVEVVCGTCARTTEGRFTNRKKAGGSITQLIRNAKKAGWVWDEEKGDWCCFNCLTKEGLENAKTTPT